MRVRNLIWALLFVIPGVLFATADVNSDQQVVATDLTVDADNQMAQDADALNLEEGATDAHRGWGGWGRGYGWGGWGGWGRGWYGGYGGWGWPSWSYSWWPFYGYW